MNEFFRLTGIFILGLVFGYFYFGMLWFTLRYVERLKRPAVLLLASFFIRICVLFAGVYYLVGGRWQNLAAFFIAFLLMRFILIQRWKPKKVYVRNEVNKNANHS